MANFEDFKQKAMDTMETIADKSIELYKVAEEKTKLLAKMTKLGAEITLEKGDVRKLYREIGKKYYEMHKSSPEEPLAQACAEVTVSLDCIAAKQKELDELKNSLSEKSAAEARTDDKDIEVEIIVEDLGEQVREEAETAPVKEPVLNVEEPAADMEDVIGSSPPEYKF
ncbi:MAG: hypothetical protein GXY05_09555 [Clostridiales bacterium]|nr:hypothetical protein [Clostridiales bacterium]